MTDKICLGVIDADNNYFFYEIDSDNDPSQLMAEEMGNGRIKVSFKTKNSVWFCDTPPVLFDLIHMSDQLSYLYLDVEEDANYCGTNANDASTLE